MHKLNIRRMYLLVPVALLFVAVIYGACTPGSEITAAESDVVLTLYDDNFDFGSVKRYAMPDSVMHITGDPEEPDSPLLSREFDDEILALVRSNFADRGYVLVDTNAVPEPEFIVLVTAQATDYWNLNTWYPWNPWCPYCWYPPPTVGVSYAFTLGTLYIQMGDYRLGTDEENPGKAHWSANMNGIMSGGSGMDDRIFQGINQSFVQSPYLKTDL